MGSQSTCLEGRVFPPMSRCKASVELRSVGVWALPFLRMINIFVTIAMILIFGSADQNKL